MQVSYKGLWVKCAENEISKHQLIEMAEVSPSTLTRLNKNEIVSLSILLKFCKILKCDVGDVVHAMPIGENFNKEIRL
ncbi:MAG: helix-turn-helix transcriptional regulator [Clostridia bacterium]|nr:helix-turn-helix transcriptional regulator [Clostridia bacterium]